MWYLLKNGPIRENSIELIENVSKYTFLLNGQQVTAYHSKVVKFKIVYCYSSTYPLFYLLKKTELPSATSRKEASDHH